MSKSGNWYIAATEGTEFTLYSMMRKLGIPLTKEQEEFQNQLERRFPPIISKEELNEGNQDPNAATT